MGMASTKQDTDVMAEINITPFTDVLLVLLIIFMILAALAAPPGFQKQLPKKNITPQNITKNVLQHQIEVDVTAQNRIYVDRKLIRMQDLYSVMANTVAFHRTHENQGYTTHVSLGRQRRSLHNANKELRRGARA